MSESDNEIQARRKSSTPNSKISRNVSGENHKTSKRESEKEDFGSPLQKSQFGGRKSDSDESFNFDE